MRVYVCTWACARVCGPYASGCLVRGRSAGCGSFPFARRHCRLGRSVPRDPIDCRAYSHTPARRTRTPARRTPARRTRVARGLTQTHTETLAHPHSLAGGRARVDTHTYTLTRSGRTRTLIHARAKAHSSAFSSSPSSSPPPPLVEISFVRVRSPYSTRPPKALIA